MALRREPEVGLLCNCVDRIRNQISCYIFLSASFCHIPCRVDAHEYSISFALQLKARSFIDNLIRQVAP